VLVGAVLVVGGLVVIAVSLFAVFVAALGLAAVRRVVHAVHPYGSGHLDRSASHPSVLIDTTATVRPIRAQDQPS
jgi:hypothetical protein